MKKRLLSFALTICMVLAMMPGMSITASALEAPFGYSVSIDQAAINNTNKTSMSFTFENAQVDASYSFTISSTGGGAPVTGSGTIITGGQQINGIDVSGLGDGTLNLSATLTNGAGTGTAVTDTVIKETGVAKNVETDTGYATLQAAVNAVTDGQTIKLLMDVTESISIPYGNTLSFTLDLNGKTLTGDSDAAIKHENRQVGGGTGSVTLTITDDSDGSNGKVTNASTKNTITLYRGGELIVAGGTVENTNSSVFDGNAIESEMFSTVKVTIAGGTVDNTGKTSAIYQVGSGDVSISDGIVRSDSWTAIYTNLGNKITISGTAQVTNNSSGYTIGINSNSTYQPTLEITGGTISNTNADGEAIHFWEPNHGTFIIPSGSAIIKGGDMAMNKAPYLSGYTNVLITASTDVSGTPTVAYDAGNITAYKYLKFEPATVTVPGAPTIGTATAGNGQATISFADPDSDGGAEITSYTVTSSPGGITETGASSPITLTGLTNGTTYTFTVTATNSEGTGAASAESNSVTPAAPSSGGGSSSKGNTPAVVTKIESGESVVSTNLDNLVKEGKKLTVEGKTGEKLVLDTEALKNIDGQTKDNIKVEIKDVSTNYKNEHPDRLVVSLTITAGGKHITNFGKGTATVSLPYELKAGEKAEDVTVWYLAEDGTMTEVPCTYDATTKLATFKVNHFSLYVVGTADISKWTNPFSDVKESSWFYDAVRYVSANGLMNGTSDTAFTPGAKTTRGMIVTILWRMENEPKASKKMTFADVKNGKYYHDAVAWASEKGIVGGYSAEEFGPENDITREQLAVILHKYAESKGFITDISAEPTGELPASISAFSDAGKIHSWGKEALSWANAEGLINGTGDNLLDPAGAAQRSQVAAILQRFIENTAK
ncbi:MAG: S-layer homology domain-containing protein [Eubacteriales bacterium]|nr:S-layer homology domain-containing protein [Eubacteriales bacterium]